MPVTAYSAIGSEFATPPVEPVVGYHHGGNGGQPSHDRRCLVEASCMRVACGKRTIACGSEGSSRNEIFRVIGVCMTRRWREVDSNSWFRARSEYGRSRRLAALPGRCRALMACRPRPSLLDRF